ncbi:MAG: DEAD/DEAH box helicase family protein [Tissierella sp.]|nr:DEAD/DEAH box helicase family protein [Tissierella sp.]
MFNLGEKTLVDRVDRYETFYRGQQYYLLGKVKDVKTNSNKDYFKSTVEGSKLYTVSASFDRYGDIEQTKCDCTAYTKYPGDCKHVVALLSFLKAYQENLRKSLIRNEEIKNIIYSYGDNTISDKIQLDVEYTYEFNPKGTEKGSYLKLRIGEDRLYSVRSTNLFFKALTNGEVLDFGKNFTFNPNVHTFKEEDKEIMDFFKILHENFVENSIGITGRNSKGMFSGTRIYLTDATLKRFFSMMKNRRFNANISGDDYPEIHIVNDRLSLDMDVLGDNKDLIVKLKSANKITPLTDDAKYIFTNGNIVKVSSEQRAKIMPLYNQAFKSGEELIKIDEEYKELFISNVLTAIRDEVNLEVDKVLEDSIYSPELKAEVYFDKVDYSIQGKIHFLYGDIKINPFSSRDNTSKTDDNRILLRNRQKENQILGILEDGNFKVIDGGIYLDDDESILELVINIIPRLQEHSEIYYSDLFKSIRIRDTFHFSGGIKVDDKLDLLTFDFDIDGVDTSELDLLFDSISEKKKFHRLRDGSFLPLENDDLIDIVNLIERFGIKDSLDNGIIYGPKYLSMYLDSYLKDRNLDFIEKNIDFKKLVQDVNHPESKEYELPKGIQGNLRDYQKFGFKWLKTLSSYGFGGILADDMGLGKTLQMITLLLSDKEEKGSMPSLIVAPTSLVFNWEEEVNKFAPDLKLLQVHGSKDERIELLKDMDNYDLIITSYPLMRRDVDLYKDLNFRYCILDEAQHIKNSNSLNAKSVKSIQAKNRFALTGTPMENSIMELWSIFDFLMPGYLHSNRVFIERFEKPIFKDQDLDKLKDLNKHIKPFILRRVKKEVLKELPEKIEQKIVVEMNLEQKKIYLAYLKNLSDDLSMEFETKGFNRSHIKILAALTRLRQLCCHPGLFIHDYEGGSGKLDSFEEIIQDAIESGHRILVFSQFKSMLDIIEERLKSKGISHMYLNGSTEMALRGEMVNDFNNGKGDIFLISLKAGGTGLNLTGADMVIHYDPWWNPAVEEQATDRAYRIGQENTVQVLKLITKGTIEEKIYKMQEKKREMIDMVIQEGETLISKLSEEEILSLFEVE